MVSTDASSLLDSARHIADDVLFPRAQDIDRAALIPRATYQPLADAGLFGIAGPAESGFADADPITARRVMATIGSGCGATFFTWVQHHGVVKNVRASHNAALREEWLEPLCRGERIAGVAFAHLRRLDRRAIMATAVDGGWRLDGHAPWATSWGIADRFAIAAESDDGRVVWAFIDGVTAEGLRVNDLPLPVFAATGTVALDFDGMVVPDDDIILIQATDGWRAADRLRAAIGQPAVLGVAERALRLLALSARGPDDPAVETAERLTKRLDAVWQRDGVLLDEISSDTPRRDDDVIAAASGHRASCLQLALDATTALLAAVGGGGLDLRHPAQRLAREAMFYVIQAQTADGRAATLRAAGRAHDPS